MGRVLVILIAVFLLLTVFRNIIRNIQQRNNPPADKKANPNLKQKKKSDDDDNIVDAKFEEIK
ncbi:MAG: OadG family protein [Ignavibacteriae bacterium]|nr:OadG family protein [Ignavibacteriota bacterium]